MARTKTELIDRVAVVSDTGRRLEVLVYQEFVDATNLQSRGEEWLPGLRQYRVAGGGHVNFRSEGTFELVETGEILKAV